MGYLNSPRLLTSTSYLGLYLLILCYLSQSKLRSGPGGPRSACSRPHRVTLRVSQRGGPAVPAVSWHAHAPLDPLFWFLLAPTRCLLPLHPALTLWTPDSCPSPWPMGCDHAGSGPKKPGQPSAGLPAKASHTCLLHKPGVGPFLLLFHELASSQLPLEFSQ